MLEFAFFGVEVALPFLGRMVFGVLRQVPMGARFLDVLDIPGPFYLDNAVELLLELIVPRLGHRNLLRHDE